MSEVVDSGTVELNTVESGTTDPGFVEIGSVEPDFIDLNVMKSETEIGNTVSGIVEPRDVDFRTVLRPRVVNPAVETGIIFCVVKLSVVLFCVVGPSLVPFCFDELGVDIGEFAVVDIPAVHLEIVDISVVELGNVGISVVEPDVGISVVEPDVVIFGDVEPDAVGNFVEETGAEDIPVFESELGAVTFAVVKPGVVIIPAVEPCVVRTSSEVDDISAAEAGIFDTIFVEPGVGIFVVELNAVDMIDLRPSVLGVAVVELSFEGISVLVPGFADITRVELDVVAFSVAEPGAVIFDVVTFAVEPDFVETSAEEPGFGIQF
ncbi:hypothetical protein TNIN_154171 [Trichonephila inaurata madagascariensis]|uniref:Uncharacterized protein n=1 Tax=Trichonephila inaurata madagascariensis TaxID=2747483 RepID=A0A8X7CEG0_9ARAC|nr:hypothetical protein TNIN_154171 [Trichonephila inaurata madagascariensis]